MASMRPRHKAAENEAALRRSIKKYSASMRPRHKAAENGELLAPPGGAQGASMRPRHKAAENAEDGSANRRLMKSLQ